MFASIQTLVSSYMTIKRTINHFVFK